MKKILIFMSALLMISGVACAEKKTDSTPETSAEPKSIEITQLMYKQEHLSFPEDMESRMGLYYHDGVKFVYKSKNEGIKIMSYDENMSEIGALTLIGDNLPREACCCTKSDGTVVMLCMYVEYDGDEAENPDDFYKNAVVLPEIRTYSPDGKLLETHEIDGFHSYEDFNYIDGLYEYGENYVISFNGGYALVSADGEILDMPNESKSLVFGTDTDGKTYVFDWQKYSVTDGKKMSLDENNAKEYGKYVNRTRAVFSGAGDFKLFVTMNEGIYGIAPNDELVQIMDFTDSNVSPSGIWYATYAGDGKFVICGDDQTLADGMFIDLLTVRPDDYVENKTDLTLGCIDWSNNAPEIAMMYSKQSDNYNVEIKKYNDIDNLKLDVLSGESPDLFAYQETAFMYRYADMGAFADMYGFMNRNDGIKQNDILENVLNAYEYKGGLYGIPIAFQLGNALIANSDVISRDYSYWNYDEFFSFAENMPDGMFLSHKNSQLAYREGVFTKFCNENCGNWIDYDNYTCDFNNEEFIHLLNFCNTVKINESIDWEEADKLSDEERHIMNCEDDIRVMNKEALLGNYSDHLDDFMSFVYVAKQNGLYANGNYTYMISPSDDRKGTILPVNDMCFSILSDTDCPDGAWDFMNYILSPYFQNNYLQTARCFTSSKESLRYKMNKAFEECRKEVQVSLDPMKYDFLPETEGIDWVNKPMTDEDAEYIKDFMSHFTNVN